MAKVFAINAGSSSLKFKLYEMPQEEVVCSGIAERIGYDNALFTLKDHHGKVLVKTTLPLADHAVAVETLIDSLFVHEIIGCIGEIEAIGHRIVQGGKHFKGSALMTPEVVQLIEELSSLAPLHNPAHLKGYHAFKNMLPEVPMVAVFDTAFHQSMEPVDYTFPIPSEYSKKFDIRRYGAHGTSHQYLSEKVATYIAESPQKRVITCHLGSGASICAIKDGKCVATSMGLTPLGGIMMGTRTGDMDPSVFYFLCKVLNKSAEEVYEILNKESGFLGVSGVSNDSRDILDAIKDGNQDANLANELFIRRVVDFIGQYYVRLGGCEAIVFSAGIGENVGYYRERICDCLAEPLGVSIDKELNLPLRETEKLISLPQSKVKIVIIPTDEEVVLARDSFRIGLRGIGVTRK